MGQYNVSIFLIHCFIPASVQVGENIVVEPFEGISGADTAELIDKYLEKVVQQPPQPSEHKAAMLNKIQEEGASVVITISNVEANDSIEAIRKTEQMLIICRDVLALRQIQRGYVAGFLTIRTDVSPVQLYSHLRRPYPFLRKVQNIPIFETESDVVTRLVEKAQRHPLLQMYLSLYADAVSHTDTLVTSVSIETRLLKTWALLEAMAFSEKGSKKQRVKALFKRYDQSPYPDYHGHKGLDLLDLAYKWRNVIAHCGGCKVATNPDDVKFCRDFHAEFEDVLEELNQTCRALLHAYANSLP
jgi:hypothetical protein